MGHGFPNLTASDAISLVEGFDPLDPAILRDAVDALTRSRVPPGHDGFLTLFVAANVVKPASLHIGIRTGGIFTYEVIQ